MKYYSKPITQRKIKHFNYDKSRHSYVQCLKVPGSDLTKNLKKDHRLQKNVFFFHFCKQHYYGENNMLTAHQFIRSIQKI